jgi:hypothetical protein
MNPEPPVTRMFIVNHNHWEDKCVSAFAIRQVDSKLSGIPEIPVIA